MGVNKQKLNDVEQRLRSQQPDPVEPPGWVTTRVLAGIEDAEPRARGDRPGWAMLVGSVGVVGVAVVVIGVGGVFRSGQTPSPAPEVPVQVASADPVDPADQGVDPVAPVEPASGGPAIRISIPASFGAPAVFEREAGRLRRDAVQLADVVRKPLQRLGSGLRRF